MSGLAAGGSEVGAARTGKEWGGKMLYRVEAKTPAARVAQIPNPPARPPRQHAEPRRQYPAGSEGGLGGGWRVWVCLRLRYDGHAAAPHRGRAAVQGRGGEAASGVDLIQRGWKVCVPRWRGCDRYGHQTGGGAHPDQREADRDRLPRWQGREGRPSPGSDRGPGARSRGWGAAATFFAGAYLQVASSRWTK